MVSGVAALGAVGSVAAATSIRWINEDVATGTFSVTNQVSTITTTTPFLCGSLGTPGNTFANKINAVFPGANAGQGSFLFGALNAGAQVPVPGLGAWTFSPTSGSGATQAGGPGIARRIDFNSESRSTCPASVQTAATSGATFLTGAQWDQWNGRLAVAMLKGEGIKIFRLNVNSIVEEQTILTSYGRIRTVQQGPDGALYFATSNGSGNDGIYRVTPG